MGLGRQPGDGPPVEAGLEIGRAETARGFEEAGAGVLGRGGREGPFRELQCPTDDASSQ